MNRRRKSVPGKLPRRQPVKSTKSHWSPLSFPDKGTLAHRDAAIRAAVQVELYNRQRQVRLDLPRLRELLRLAVTQCLPLCGRGAARLTTLDEIAVTVVSDRKIAQLHRRFLNVPGPTDVITFEHGEIVVSATTAAARCVMEEETLDRELARYLVHGLLHLNGHLDEDEADAAAMWSAQESALATLWPGKRHAREGQRPGIASSK